MAQLKWPTADGDKVGFSDEGGGTTNLYLKLADDLPTTYVRSALPPTNDIYRFEWAAPTDPTVHTNHNFTLDLGKNADGGKSLVVQVRLYEGGTGTAGSGTQRASWTSATPGLEALGDLPSAVTRYTFDFSAQAANIVSYAALWVEVEVNQP